MSECDSNHLLVPSTADSSAYIYLCTCTSENGQRISQNINAENTPLLLPNYHVSEKCDA